MLQIDTVLCVLCTYHCWLHIHQTECSSRPLHTDTPRGAHLLTFLFHRHQNTYILAGPPPGHCTAGTGYDSYCCSCKGSYLQ